MEVFMKKPCSFTFKNDRLSAEVSIPLSPEWEFEGEAKLREIEDLIAEIHLEHTCGFALCSDCSITILATRTNCCPSIRIIIESESLPDDQHYLLDGDAKQDLKCEICEFISDIKLAIGCTSATIFFNDGTSCLI